MLFHCSCYKNLFASLHVLTHGSYSFFFFFITTDDKASDRVLRRRSKRQKTVSVLTHSVSTSCSSTFSSSGGERDESLNISSEINEENTEKGVKKVSYMTHFLSSFTYMYLLFGI